MVGMMSCRVHCVADTVCAGKQYFELKVPPLPRMDGVFSRGGSDAFYQ